MSMQRLAVEQARRLFRAKGGPPLYVTFHFASEHAISKTRAYELGPILADALAKTRLPRRIQDPLGSIDLDLLPSELAAISVHGSVDATDELWYSGSGGWVAPVERTHIEAEIARKAALLSSIRAKCEEAWLLIVNDGFRGAPPCELSRSAITLGFQSPFDRTFWLHYPNIYELDCSSNER